MKTLTLRKASAPPDVDSLLSVIATPVKEPTKQLVTKYSSRFFFRMIEDEVSNLKAIADNPKPVIENKELVEYSEKLQKELPPQIQANILQVRSFFIKELTPLTLALDAGMNQAIEAVKNVTGSEIEPSTFMKFEKMMHQAVMIRMASFLESYMCLPKGSASKLLNPVKPVRRKVSMPPVANVPDRPGPSSKETKTLTHSLQRILDMQDKGGKHGPIFG